jgi:hypothetical protein
MPMRHDDQLNPPSGCTDHISDGGLNAPNVTCLLGPFEHATVNDDVERISIAAEAADQEEVTESNSIHADPNAYLSLVRDPGELTFF